MASEGNVSKNKIVSDDIYSKYKSTTFERYEKTTDTQEKTDGLWGIRGSSDYQGKIWASGSRALFLFTKAREYIPEVSSISDNNYSEDTKPMSAVQGSGFRAYVPLLDGETVAPGDELSPTTGGKTIKRLQGQKVAIALETKAASGSDEDLLVSVSLDSPSNWTTETLSASANSIVLTNIPIVVNLVEITSGTITGGKILMESGTVVSGEAKVDYSTGKISFHASDAPVNVFVRYMI